MVIEHVMRLPSVALVSCVLSAAAHAHPDHGQPHVHADAWLTMLPALGIAAVALAIAGGVVAWRSRRRYAR